MGYVQDYAGVVWAALKGEKKLPPYDPSGASPNHRGFVALIQGIEGRGWFALLDWFQDQEEFGFQTFRRKGGVGLTSEQCTSHHDWAYTGIVGAARMLGPSDVKMAADRWVERWKFLAELGRSPSGIVCLAGRRVLERKKLRTSLHRDVCLQILRGDPPSKKAFVAWPPKWQDFIGPSCFYKVYKGHDVQPVKPKLALPMTIRKYATGHTCTVENVVGISSGAPSEDAYFAWIDYQTGEMGYDEAIGAFPGEPIITEVA